MSIFKRVSFFIGVKNILALSLLLIPFLTSAQKNIKPADTKHSSASVEKQTVQIHHANSLEFDKRLGDGAERLIGNVELEDDSVLMNCDSAYVYQDNTFRAFGHVHLNRKDSVHLFGDSLHYHGDTKQAEMFGKILCKEKSMTLNTQHLLYDLNADMVNYWDGGTLVDSTNTLVSTLGNYNTLSKIASFKQNVVLTNPNYKVTCDTMNYSPSLQTAYFEGPTYITSKSNKMYCVAGYYNTKSGVSQFWNHAIVTSKKGEKLSGDSLYFNRKIDSGEVKQNVALTDSTDNITIRGNYAVYKGLKKTIMVTRRAVMQQAFEKDTLHLHGDTLFGLNISMSDTMPGNSSAPKLLLAYHHVQFFKKDMQGKCDSLTYDEKDSIMRMFRLPVVWSDHNQLTADTMHLFLENKKLSKLDMINNSFIISRDTLASKDDSLQFNQIKGRNMRGFFKNNKIFKVKVMGNAQTIYYVYSDNNTTLVSANRADCSNMLVYIDSNRVHSITYLQKPDATLFPTKDIKPADFLLGNFNWREAERPKKKEDIFGDEKF